MKINKVKSLTVFYVGLTDIYDGWLDVFVTLEDDDSEYSFEVTTPQALASQMDRTKQKFVEPDFPCIIVRELTGPVIKEAIEAFLNDEEAEDDFWFKLYHSIPYFTTDDLNLIIDRHNKEMQAEEEED